MIIQILTAIFFYFVLMYISVNLLGLFARGLFSNPELDRLKSEGHEFIKNEIKKSQRADNMINVIALILIVAFIYELFHFWNIGVMAVSILLMAGRLQGLLWEIKNGKKTNTKLMPKNVIYYTSALFTLCALPVLYYFLYHF